MRITLYEVGPTRSKRCRWTLKELGLDFESVTGPDLIGSERLRAVHPLAAVPAVEIDGKSLFESAAICTYLADSQVDKQLIAASGTWARAQHDQWCYFVLTEMEMYTWTIARNKFVLPKEKRLSNVFEQNAQGYRRGAKVLDDKLSKQDYLVENKFSVTDIIVSFTVNWGRLLGLIDDFPNLQHYLDRVCERPHCTLRAQS